MRPILGSTAVCALALFLAPSWAGAATCPFNIQVVSLGPSNDPSGFHWSAPIRPLGDACLSAIEVDPADEQTWYAAGTNGVYQTHNGGLNWTHPLAGAVSSQGLRLVPGSPSLVYAGVGNRLFLSRDKGQNWTQIGLFPQPIESVFVSRVGTGRILVGLSWSGSAAANGIFISANLGGASWQKKLFPNNPKNLIVWDIEANPQDAALYAPCEIANHPQPYHPPLYRSLDGGMTWVNVAGEPPPARGGGGIPPAPPPPPPPPPPPGGGEGRGEGGGEPPRGRGWGGSPGRPRFSSPLGGRGGGSPARPPGG